MESVRRLLLPLALIVACGASADPPPANPSFAQDVLPVMNEHCVRCHGAGGELHGDKTSTNPAYQSPPETGYFNQYDDTVVNGMVTKAGAKSLATEIKLYVHFGEMMRMPPAPAEPLSDWELKLIDNWVGAPGTTPKP